MSAPKKRTELLAGITTDHRWRTGYEGNDIWADKLPGPLYKFLSAKGTGTHQYNFAWPLPTKNEDGSWTPGEWVEVEYPLAACSNGLHFTTAQQARHWMSERLFEVEVEGGGIVVGGRRPDFHGGKIVAKKARLTREIETWAQTRWSGHVPRPHFPEELHEENLAKLREMLPAQYRKFVDDPKSLQSEISRLYREVEVVTVKAKIQRGRRQLWQLTGKGKEVRRVDEVGLRTKRREINATINRLSYLSAIVHDTWHLAVGLRLGRIISPKTLKFDFQTWDTIWREMEATIVRELTPKEDPKDYGDIPQDIVTALLNAGYTAIIERPRKRTE